MFELYFSLLVNTYKLINRMLGAYLFPLSLFNELKHGSKV